MKKILIFIKKYILAIIIAFIVLIVGSFLIIKLVPKENNIKLYDGKYVKFNYDSYWKITADNNLSIKLENKNKGLINIELLELDNNYKYEKLENILENLLFDLNKQNKDYNLIFKKATTLTHKALDGYEVLYEANDSEILLDIAKNNDNLLIFTYEANNKYFDMLLDSVQNIIYKLEIKENKYELNNKLELSTKDISFLDNTSLDNKIKDNKEYKVSSNNYSIKYSIPDIFSPTILDSRRGSFNYQDGNINITTTIYNKNIYDYLDKSKDIGTIYEEFNYYKENRDKYSDFSEQISKYKVSTYDSYLYQVFYTDISFNKKYENYYLIIPINKNHLFLIKIVGENCSISKKLIDSFKINDVINYSSYIEREVKNGYFNINLERLNNNNNNTDLIAIKLPEKYQEIDKDNDMYSNRYIGLNKDLNNNTYQYNINYYLTSSYSNINSVIDLINSNNRVYQTYGNYTELKYLNNLTLNGKQYQVYESSYFKLDNLFNQKGMSIFQVYEKVLIYELENGGELVITIDGNNQKIEDSMLSELTDITILNN